MDMGSSSFSASAGGASGSSDSPLNGLKFGKKIYFEDVGIGVSAKSDGGSSSVSEVGPTSASTTAKKGRGVLQGGQPPRCQVEGCKVDLSGSKPYYSRHKVCGMHSKSPKVIVAGLEQRFCQQCSRFHQLSEFDQGKRSCRRRLAGHNERRRKPQPGSLFSARYGRFPSSFQENSNRVGSFLMDFTTYPKLPGRDVWPTVRAGNWAPGNQPTATGKFLPHHWQGSSENPPANEFANSSQPYLQGSACGTSNSSHSYLQGSAGGTIFSSSRIPPGECFAGVSESGCALSLLSTQPWGPRNQASGLSMNNLMNDEGSSMAQSTAPHGAAVTNYMTNVWNFKGSEVGGSSHEMQPINSNFSDELELAQQQGDRHYMEHGQPRAYAPSTHQMHWSL